jgi:CubicO group peptidase (beta-lactamase class C family)
MVRITEIDIDPEQRRMTRGTDRRRFLELAMCGALAACAGGRGISSSDEPAPPPQSQIDQAIAELDKLANDLMKGTGVPGMAVAVVRRDQKVYAKGFGTRAVGAQSPVDADTVFQLASVSKSVGATVVAREVGLGRVQWDTRLKSRLPWFALSDPHASDDVTIADMYSHRSGLPPHAGDRLEDMGYDRRQVLERLRYQPLDPFRKTYHYTNFGLTAGAEAVCAAVGVDWATLSDSALYQPLGMTRTSSRYADFLARPNRAVGHVKQDGQWVQSPLLRDPDAQSPAGGASSSVNDMANWLAMMLGEGVYAGRRVIDAPALAAAVSPQILTAPASGDRPASHYGFGFNVGSTANGRYSYNHSGGFASGAGTFFKVVPSTGIAFVALTNGYPLGIPETLGAQFFDLVEVGSIQRDWYSIFNPYFLEDLKPEGSLVGAARPSNPTPPRPLNEYTGAYANLYHGPAVVSLENGTLVLTIGPAPVRRPLTYWGGDAFTFTLHNENATPGTISKATFAGNRLTLEYYDHERLGTFVRGQ